MMTGNSDGKSECKSLNHLELLISSPVRERKLLSDGGSALTL